MPEHIVIFRPYPFQVGQKIHVESGPKRGDWEILEVTDKKVRFKCPLSGKDFLWEPFCYVLEELAAAQWPSPDEP